MLDKQPPLNVSRTLYDSDGYRHCLVQATPAQVLTLLEGFYWLWDRATGKCLLEGMATTRLSNAKPSSHALRLQQPSRVAETRALLLAQKTMMKAALSSSSQATRPASEGRPGADADAA